MADDLFQQLLDATPLGPVVRLQRKALDLISSPSPSKVDLAAPPDESKTGGVSGPVYSLEQILGHPYRSAVAAGDLLSQQATGAIQQGQKVVQSLVPASMQPAAGAIAGAAGIAIPGAFNEAMKAMANPPSPEQSPSTVGQRAFTILNNAPLIGGIPQATKDAFLKSAKDADQSSIEDKYVRPAGDAALEAIHQVLPFREFATLLRGTTIDPQTGEEHPISPEDATRNLAIGAMKTYGAGQAMEHILPKDGPKLTYEEDLTKANILKQTKSMGEIIAARSQGEDVTAGSMPVPLTPQGVSEVRNAAQRIGPVDQLVTSNIRRAKQSAQVFSDTLQDSYGVAAPQAQILPDLDAWHLGPLEGQVSSSIRDKVNALVADSPGKAPKGQAPFSTAPGESFNSYRTRTLGALQDQLENWEANPNRTLVVQHSKNLELLQAWIDNGAPKNLSVQPDAFDQHTSGAPGSIYQLSRDPATGLPRLEDVSNAPPVSDPALLLMRHGTTSFDADLPSGSTPTIGRPTGSVAADAYAPPSPKVDPGFEALPQAAKENLYQQDLLKDDVTKRLVADNIFHPIVQKFLLNYDPAKKADSSINDAIVQAIAAPDSQSKYISTLGEVYGQSIDNMKDILSKGVDKAAAYGGSTLKIFSDAMQSLHDDLIQKAQSGTIQERSETNRMLQSVNTIMKGTPATGWQKTAGLLGKIENLRRAEIVTPLAVAAGNFAAQGLTYGATIADAFNTSVLKSLRQGSAMVGDLISGDPVRPFNASAQLADVTEALMSLYRHFPMTQGFHPIDTILNGAPLTQKRTLGGVLFEADSGLFGNVAANSTQLLREAHVAMNENGGIASTAGWNAAWDSGTANFKQLIDALPFEKFQEAKSRSATVGHNLFAAGELTADMLNTANRAQETWFRRILFDARFRANLRTQGMSFEEAQDHLMNRAYDVDPESGLRTVRPIPEGLRQNLMDSEMHALKNTFAMTPQGGLLGGTLNAMGRWNREVFPLTAVTVTFPRFMVNNIIWQSEHSPMNVMNLFNPETRASLGAAAEDGNLGSTTNMRRMGQAATGAMLTGVGYLMASGHAIGGYIQGPKPNLLWNGERDAQGNPKYLDISSLQPFYGYAMAGNILHKLVNNRPMGFAPEDYEKAFTNNNTADSPLFSLNDIMRNINSDNPDTVYENAAKPFGEYLGSWFQVIKGMRDEVNAFGPSSIFGDRTRSLMQPDVEHQPLAGPILRGANPTALPPRYDPFMNKYITEENPGEAIAHFEAKPMTPFKEWLTKNNISPNSITPDFKSPAANDELRRYAGAILATPAGQGQILQNAFHSEVPPLLVGELSKFIDPTGKDNTIDGFAKRMMAATAAASNWPGQMQVAGQQVSYADYLDDLNKYAISKIKDALHKEVTAHFDDAEAKRAAAGQGLLAPKMAAKRIGSDFSSLEGPLLHYLHDNPSAGVKSPVDQESPQEPQ